MPGILQDAMGRLLALAGAALFLLAGIVTALVALYWHLLTELPRAGALAIVAGIVLLAGLVLLALARQRNAAPKLPGDDALETIRRRVKADPLGTALGAVALGFASQATPEMRKLLQALLASR